MNDLDLCLEVVSRSYQLLCYIWRWISRKLLQIEAWFQKTTNRKWYMGYQMVTWPTRLRTRRVLYEFQYLVGHNRPTDDSMFVDFVGC